MARAGESVAQHRCGLHTAAMAGTGFRRTRGRSGAGGAWTDLAGKLRETLAQAGAVREVLERGAREGRARLQGARTSRQRDAVLAELGGAILDLIQRGEIDAGDLPEIQPLLARLDELEAGGDGGEREAPVWG